MASNNRKINKDAVIEKVLDGGEYFLTGIVILSLITAVVLALFWVITSLYVPYENYKILQEVVTADGQYLKIEYPQRVLANNKPVNLILTLNGTMTTDAEFTLTFPGEIRLSGYQDNASKRAITHKFTNSGTDGRVYKIALFNSKTIKDSWWRTYTNQIVILNSKDLEIENLPINIQMETVGWARIRDFVNNSVNDKSPLILLASGLISWAGGYLLQSAKDKHESRQKNKEDKRQYEQDLLDSLQKNPIFTIRGFIADHKKEGYEDFQDIYVKLEIAGCHHILIEKVFALWQVKSLSEAQLVINDLVYLKDNFSSPVHFSKDVTMLEKLQDMIKAPDGTMFKQEDVRVIYDAFVLWGETLRPLLILIIKKIIEVPANLPLMQNIFGTNDSPNILLLRDSKIQDKLLWYWENPERVLTKEESDTIADNQKKYLVDERISLAKDLYRRLSTNIKWKPLWQQKGAKFSDRMYKWLKSNDPDFTDFSFGEELAELDGESLNRKKEKTESFERWVEHPLMKNIWHAKPLLLFAGEGMGKTASAYYLVDICKNPKPEKYSGAFPIYATFQNNVDVKEWLVASVAQALVDFISENPRRFLDAELAQRVAMGRLILFYTKTLDRVKVTFKRSGHTSNDDWAQILVQLEEMGLQSTVNKKITDIELMDLFDKARPDGFSRSYLILDVSSRSIVTENLGTIKEIGRLILPLLQVDFFIKAFLPIEFKTGFDKTLIEILGVDLTWDEQLLQEMLKLRFERFTTICDIRRTVRMPFKSIAIASSRSPRRAIRYGNALMEHAEENLKDFQKLDSKVFEIVRKKLIERGFLFDT